MKQIFSKSIRRGLIIFPVLMLSFIACNEDFLTITPEHYLTDGTYYSTADEFNEAVIAVYSDLQKYALSAHYFEEGRSDNTMYDNQHDAGSKYYFFLDQFLLTSEYAVISNAWTTIYGAIKDCNIPLYYLSSAEIDEDLATQYEGELRFFRAFFHFVAVRYWGEIPLLLEPILTTEEAFAITQSPVDDVYAAILEDAEYAASVLADSYTGDDIGRVTSGAANMLLAEIYMTRHNYSSAQTKLEAIVSSGQYQLLANYADVFDPNNKNNEESIFEVQFADGSDGEASNFMYQFAPIGATEEVIVGPESGGGKNIPTLDMVEAYETGDLRKDVSVAYYDRSSDPLYYVKKYDHDSDPDYSRTPDNWPIYRYADALLMLAEALNEQGYSTGTAFTLLNQVRNRADLVSLTSADIPDQDSFRDAVAQERRVELAFENHRWFDLLRTGTAIEVMTAFGIKEMANPTMDSPFYAEYDSDCFNVTEDKLLFPLPSEELDKNPNLVQNTGY